MDIVEFLKYLILFIFIAILILLFILLVRNIIFGRESFQDTGTTEPIPPSELTETEATTLTEEEAGAALTEIENIQIDTKNIQYISCAAFERFDEKNEEKSGTTALLNQAPFWFYFSKANTLNELLTDFANNIKTVAGKNKNSLKGPCYMIVGRNKNEKRVEGYVYLPSVNKNGLNTTSIKEYTPYHIWMRKLLFSSSFGVDHWLCYNSCNDDRELTSDQRQVMRLTNRTPGFKGACGCISTTGSCKYYYLPLDISIRPRNIADVSSYSVYTFLPDFFTNLNITIEDPTQLEMDRMKSGSRMFEGCDSKLVSKNRLHAFQIEPDGFAFYDASRSMPFTDTCIQKPTEITFYDNAKVLKKKYNTTGQLPRLVNEDSDVGIYTINTNNDTNNKELVKKWDIDRGPNSPYEFFLDNDGNLKIIDSKGVAQDVTFIKNK